MRHAVLYILAVLFLVFGGYRYAHGADRHINSGYSTALHIEKSPQLAVSAAGKNNTLNTAIAANEKIVSVETEDDELTQARKFVPLARAFVALVYAAFVLAVFKALQKRLYAVRPTLATIPCKYLALGTLRI